jgi:hypothetical protein
VHTGTARSRECRPFSFIAKARADAAHLLSSPFPKGDALRDRSRHGARELGRVVEQRIIRGGHGGIHARLQISQPTQRADDPVADLLENRSNGSIAGRLALDKPAIFASAYNHLFTKAISLWRTKFLRCTGKAKYAIQVVITTDEGQIETQHIACVEREDLTPTTLGLTLAEGKTILKALQAVVVEQQMTAYLETQRSCAHCGHLQRSKGSHTTQVRTVLGPSRSRAPACISVRVSPIPPRRIVP